MVYRLVLVVTEIVTNFLILKLDIQAWGSSIKRISNCFYSNFLEVPDISTSELNFSEILA